MIDRFKNRKTQAKEAPALWTAREVAVACLGRSDGDWRAIGVSIDTRTLVEGDLFVALKGPNFDGHDFVAAAIEAGAAGCLVSGRVEGIADRSCLVMVNDTFQGLGDLGRAARDRTGATIVAVTGSVGKTGVKEALKAVLSEQGVAGASVGNLNNRWGLPLSLARLPRDARYGVLELGMNHAGELSELTRIARPDVAIVTTVNAAHRGNFRSEEAIADAKAEIFEGLEAGGTVVLNRDNRHFERLRKACEKLGVANIATFGKAADSTVRLIDCHISADGGDVAAMVNGADIVYRVGIPGEHWVMNSLCVLAGVLAAGADWRMAAGAMRDLTPPKGRGRRHAVALARGAMTLIDESYNASPASMRAALSVLSSAETGAGGRRIAVLGDMLELGESAPCLHADLAKDVKAAGLDKVFTVGPLMANLRDALPPELRGGHADTAERLSPLIANAIRAGDVVTVKGSLGLKMGRIVGEILNMAAKGDGNLRRAANGEV